MENLFTRHTMLPFIIAHKVDIHCCKQSYLNSCKVFNNMTNQSNTVPVRREKKNNARHSLVTWREKTGNDSALCSSSSSSSSFLFSCESMHFLGDAHPPARQEGFGFIAPIKCSELTVAAQSDVSCLCAARDERESHIPFLTSPGSAALSAFYVALPSSADGLNMTSKSL